MRDAAEVLRPGTRLGELEIERVLGAGGFGVTYLARDLSLDVRRAVKEYLPRDCGTRRGDGTIGPRTGSDVENYRWGLKRFLKEARILARFDHRHLVRVQRAFAARGTAYMVMEYVEGRTLKKEVEASGPMTEARVREVLAALTDGLAAVHAEGLLHRDISPENVMVRPDGTAVLIDFGAARQMLGSGPGSQVPVLKRGYAPIEQYSEQGHLGPWTDIYALGAVAYWALSGEAPAEATERVRADRLLPVAQVARQPVSARLAAAVDAALAVHEPDRPQSLEEWRSLLEPRKPPQPGANRKVGAETVGGRQAGSTARRWRPARVAAVGLVAALVAVLTVLRIFQPGGSVSEEGPDAPAPSGAGAAVVTPAVEPEELATQDDVSRENMSEGTDDGRNDPAGTVGGEANGEGDAGGERAAVVESGEAVLPVRADPAAVIEGPRSVLGGGALLVVETTPPGAEVLVDGTRVGETPLERSDIRAGVWEVTLQHPHYETMRLPDRNFEDDVVLRVDRVLERGLGRLTVTATPRETWVEVDGARLAEGTPVTLEGIPAGPVDVRLGAPEHRPLEVEIEIPKDGLARLARTLERIPYGSLTLELEPPDATVTLPDLELRYQPGVRLPEGSHRVVLRSADYLEAVHTVDVSGITRVRIALELALQAGETRVFDGMEFVWVPAGEFSMGSTSADAHDNEQPVTQVRISRGFWLGQHEVTQAEWQGVMGTNPSRFSGCEQCPVETVSWNDAQDFIGRLNARSGGNRYRLPTEAEWEYAARAGTTGDRYGNLEAIAWQLGFSGMRTQPVGQKAPNAWGLYDMLGNVFEWVGDWYGDYPGGAVTDPRGPVSGSRRVDRGGCWFSIASSCRSSYRDDDTPGYRYGYLGFRLLRTE